MQLHASGDEEHGISMQCGRIIQHVHDVCSFPCFQVMYNVLRTQNSELRNFI